MKTYLIGIDIGTSGCKIAVFNKAGEVLAAQSGTYPVYYPKPGWAEQNPEDWWNTICQVLPEMLQKAEISPDEIAGIGIDGQSWSAIAVDENGNVLTNTPIWMDTRAQDICDELNERIGKDRIFKLCGNSLQPSYTTPKIVWYQRNLPEVYAKTAKILQSNGYIAFKLTGKMTQDVSQGYGLHCFNMQEMTWDFAMCEELGFSKDLLPEIYPCHAVIGTVTEEAAKESGLCVGIPVVAGGLDAACAALGVGVLHDGETQEQGGQAGGMSICMDHYCADERLILGAHVVPGHWLLQGGTTGGGGVMRWLEKEFGDWEREEGKRRGVSSLDLMNEEAKVIPAGSDGVVFLPYVRRTFSDLGSGCERCLLRIGFQQEKRASDPGCDGRNCLCTEAQSGSGRRSRSKSGSVKSNGRSSKFTPLDTDQIRCDRKNHGSPLIRYCNHIGSGTSCRSRSRNV